MTMSAYAAAIATLLALSAPVALPAFACVQAPCAKAAGPAPTGLDKNGHLAAARAASRDGFGYARLKNGVQFRIGAVSKNVIFYGPTTVRVNANLGENHWKSRSIVILNKPAKVAFEIEEAPDTVTIKSANLRISIDRETGALSFMDKAGRLYTRESNDPQAIEQVTISGAPTYEVENRLTLKPEEAIFGFGYTDSDDINRRDKDLLLVQTNLGIIIPVMMSSERYGSYPGMVKRRTLNLVIADEANGKGIEKSGQSTRSVIYTGPSMVVKFK